MQRALHRQTWLWAIVGAAVVALFFIALPGRALMADEGAGRLIVTGRAELTVEPDMAIVHVGVETRGETVEEARQANAEAMQRVQSRLLSMGLDPSAVKSRGYSVYPEWRYNQEDGTQTLVGYRATHTLEVTVNELDMLGTLLDAAMEEGANQIAGPMFGVKDAAALEAEALREAVRRARAKADVLASASGVFLKGIAEIRESVSLPWVAGARVAFAVADSLEKSPTPIAPGEVSVSATVTISYEI